MHLNNIILPVMLLLVSTLPCRAQESQPLTFQETEWNFGVIKEDGGPVTHEFKFRNSGDTPIAIDRVTASCGCTTPTYTRSLVQPGDSGSVNVTFEPMGYPGQFSKSVVVVSGGGKYHDLLILSGEATPRVKTIEEEYPFEMAGGLRVDNSMLAFRQIAQGGVASMVVRYVNTSDKSVELEVTTEDSSGLLEINAPETICAGCRGEMTFTYNLTEKEGHYGMLHDTVRFIVDGQASEKTVYTTMIGVDDFSTQSIELAPRMVLSGQYHNFGEVRKRTVPYTYRITLSNEGEEPLHIRSVAEKSGMKATIRGGMSVAAGASLPFEVLFYSDKYASGEIFESIIVTTNDPLRPVREIRISAKVK